MRLFLAIDIPEKLKEEGGVIQEEIKDLGNIRLVDEKQIHITLKFIGEAYPEKVIEKLKGLEFENFSLVANKIGFFPNKNYIKVLWLGFEESEDVQKLYSNINSRLESLTKKNEHEKFIPHATIARIQYLTPDNKKKLQTYNSREVPNISFEVSNIKLMKSTLTSEGPIYEVLEEFAGKAL